MLDIWLPNRSVEEAMQKSNHQNAKLQPSKCKVTAIKMQSCNYQDAKLQLSECKVTKIGMPFQIFSISI